MGQITIDIGGIAIRVRSKSESFRRMLEERYEGFVTGSGKHAIELDVDLVPPQRISEDEDLQASFAAGRWTIARGDFHAECDLAAGRGRVRQSENPYAIDSLLRVLHTLVLAREGGFLVHAASAVRGGRAFLFAGVSGAGKTTISRLAPPDATLLTDEISYLRRAGEGYEAFGTPFAGELARSGENVRAPLAAVYLLAKGEENRIEPLGAADAARGLLESVLFFAEDPELVKQVFAAACELVARVPVRRLTFVPDTRAWDLVR